MKSKETEILTDTEKEWAVFPFTFDGHNFVSIVNRVSDAYKKIQALPDGVFIQMNLQCLEALVGRGLSIEAIKKELSRINKNGTQMFIGLVESEDSK